MKIGEIMITGCAKKKQCKIKEIYLSTMESSMTAKFAETFIAMNAKSLPKENSQIAHLKSHLSAISPEQEILVQATNLKSPSTGLLLAFLLGGLGIDRFYNGQTLLGVLKLLTLGGLGIWSFIDLFLIMKAVRKRNYEHLMAIPILNSTSSLPNETQLISNEE